MVDDESRVGVTVDQRRNPVEVAGARQIDREVVPNGCARDAVDARVARVAPHFLPHHDAYADRARRLLPVGNDLGNRRIIRVDWLDDGEPAGMAPLHFRRITGVVLVQRKGGDENRAVHADLVQRRDHLVTGDVIGPIRHAVPRPFRCVRLIGVNLRIDDRHRGAPLTLSGFVGITAVKSIAALLRRCGLSPLIRCSHAQRRGDKPGIDRRTRRRYAAS